MFSVTAGPALDIERGTFTKRAGHTFFDDTEPQH